MILLVGGTGLLGSRIAAKLRERGVAFRALIRDGSDAAGIAGGEAVRGDLHRADTLAPAVADVTTVITTANSIARRLGGDKSVSISATDIAGNENLIDAAERAGVERFVFLSAADTPEMRAAPFVRAKRRIEGRLARSPLREVIVQPEMFQEVWLSEAVQLDWRNGKATVFGRGETPHAYVAVDDVAEATVRLALADDPPRVVAFGGSEALTRNEVVRRFERAGRPMKVRRVPRSALRAGAAALSRVNPVLASLLGMAWAADLQPAPLPAKPLRDLGIEPRAVGDYIDDIARAG